METRPRPRSLLVPIALLLVLVPGSTRTAVALSSVLHVPSSAYPTVQSAVDAAGVGDTVLVRPGTFVEQVTISHDLSVVGAGVDVTVIKAPPVLALGLFDRRSIVEIKGGARVRMTGLTVSGPAEGTCPDAGINRGIAVLDGATLDLRAAAVRHIHDTPVTADCFRDGGGIAIGAIFTGSTGHATIADVAIDDYQSAGITLFEPGSTATITDSVIAGPGPSTVAFTSGIDFGFGAVATITHNVVGGNACDSPDLGCGPDPLTQFQASGIGPVEAGPGTVIAYNTVSGNDVGLYVFGSEGAVLSHHNTLLDNRYFGLAIQDGSNASSFDRIAGGQVGVAVIADAVDVVGTLTGERIRATSVTAVKEISCCGFTATAVVKR